MKTAAIVAFTLVATTAGAHPGHGAKGWFHKHQDTLIDVAMIAGACLFAAIAARLFWKLLSRP